MTILETIPIFAQPGNYNNLTLISFIIVIMSIIIVQALMIVLWLL